MTDKRALCWSELPALIADVQAIGDATGLSYIAAQADLGDPEPMADEHGRPYAETSFRWIDPAYAYWRDRKLALHIAFLTAARLVAENRAIRPLLARGEEVGLDLAVLAAGDDADLRLSALKAGNDTLRAALIELQAQAEAKGATDLQAAIWAELVASTERRKLASSPV